MIFFALKMPIGMQDQEGVRNKVTEILKRDVGIYSILDKIRQELFRGPRQSLVKG